MKGHNYNKVLVIRELNKSYKVSLKRNLLVLNNISFTFKSKGLYFVLGKSGSGKSTLLNILTGLTKADSGEVLFYGRDILKFNKEELRHYLCKDVSILFQKYNLLEDMTLIENIEVTESINGIKNKQLVDDLLNKYGLYEKKSQLVSTLSGGEKQRLALIRALIKEPQILFCDEPTGALDEENSISLIQHLKELSKKILVIVVTHNYKLFEIYKDNYLVLENGNIAIKKEDLGNFDVNNSVKKENKANRQFVFKITKKNAKLNWKKDLLNTISTAFSIFIVIMSLFLSTSISGCKDDLVGSYADTNTFIISSNKTEEIQDSPIDLVKSERPKYEFIYPIFKEYNCLVNYSYDYFFKYSKDIKVNNRKIENFEIKPYVDLSLPANSMIINNKMATLIGQNIIGNELSLNIKCNLSYISERTNMTITETFEKEIPFVIKKIVSEFDYMNTPYVFYSSLYFESILKNTIALNSSIDRNVNISFFDLLKECKDDSDISSYSYNIFSLDQETNNNLIKLISENKLNELNLELSNRGYTLVSSFISISESLFIGMQFFIALLFLTSLFISGFLSYSSIISNRREIAILRCLGGKDNFILEIYLLEQLLYAISGIAVGVIFSFLVKDILNIFLGKYFAINSLIRFDISIIIVIVSLSIIFIIVANYVPLKFTKINSIAEELKEE